MANLLVFSLIFLNAFDAVSTHWAVGMKGYAYEANPLMAWLISKGWGWFYLLKLGLLTPGLLVLLSKKDIWTRTMTVSIGVLVLIYLAVAWVHVGLTWKAYRLLNIDL